MSQRSKIATQEGTREGEPMPNGNEGMRLAGSLVAQIRKLRRQGLPIRRIAKLAGVSKTTVEKYTAEIAAERLARVEVDREMEWEGFAEEVEPVYERPTSLQHELDELDELDELEGRIE